MSGHVNLQADAYALVSENLQPLCNPWDSDKVLITQGIDVDMMLFMYVFDVILT